MGVFTAQMGAVYYERFKNNEVMFSKEMIQATGLIPEQMQLKFDIHFWPCVLYAASFQGAKILIGSKSGIMARLREGVSHVNIRFAFKSEIAGKAIAFFVGANVASINPYKNNEEYSLLTFRFPHHPPDHFIEIMGRVMDADENFAKQTVERIILNEENQRRLKLSSRETAVFIQRVPRRCLLRELSFSSAKMAMTGIAKFLLEKETALRIDFDDPRDGVLLKGKFTVSENVQGKKELLILSMDFDQTKIPINYKIRINEYLKHHRRHKHTDAAVTEEHK